MDASKLERIRNILAKAEDPAATPAEAESYTALATQLMAKYGIEEAMLAAAPNRERATVGSVRITCAAPYAMEKVTLLNGIARAMGLSAVLLHAEHNTVTTPAGARIMHVFGFEVDIERAELLYTSLLLQSATAMHAAEASGERRSWEDVKAWRRSFLNAFATTVSRRVEAAEVEARTTFERERADAGPSTALVVADRSKAVAAAVREVYPRLGNGPRRSLSGGGGHAGRAAGAAANIGGRSLNGGRAALGR